MRPLVSLLLFAETYFFRLLLILDRGLGRCQAGFCSPRVLEILSRELGVPQEELTKSGGASFPIVGKTRKDGENA